MQFRCIPVVVRIALLVFVVSQIGYAQQPEKAATTNSPNEKQKKKGDPRRGVFLFAETQGGVMFPRDALSSHFARSEPGMLVGGLRWRHFRVSARLESSGSDGSDLYSAAFVASSGYRRESLTISATAFSLLFGYDMFISRTLSVGPFVALEQRSVIEGDELPYDPHPNWDLGARSRSQPVVGFEFTYRGSLHNDAQTDREQHSFLLYNVGVQVSRVRYDNSEYGNGAIWFLYVGVGYEFRLFY